MSTQPAQQQQQQQQQPQQLETLPPLPPGLAISHLSQYGNASLEMAIRMGMGIGMGMAFGQQQSTPSSQQPQEQQQAPSPQPTEEQLAFMQAALAAMSPPPVGAPSPEASSGPSRQQSGDIVSNILNDNFFATRSPLSTSPTPSNAFPQGFTSSRRPSQSGELGSQLVAPPEVEALAKRDPLAAQVWKAYARAKETLPHGQRMENLTWRMMHLTMKKKEDAERAAALAAGATATGASGGALPPAPPPEPSHRRVEHVSFQGLSPVPEPEHEHEHQQYPQSHQQQQPQQHRQSLDSSDQETERGRRKGVSKVVGFTAGNRDSR